MRFLRGIACAICVCSLLCQGPGFALSPESMLSEDNRWGTWLGARLHLLFKAMKKYGLSGDCSVQDLVLETFQGSTLEWLTERTEGSKTFYGFKVQGVIVEVSYDTVSNQARLETVQGVGRSDLEKAMADLRDSEKEYVRAELPEQGLRLELERADIPGAMWAGRLIQAEQRLIDLQNELESVDLGPASLKLNTGLVWLQRGIYRRLVRYPSWYTLVMALGTGGALRAMFGLDHDVTLILMVDGPSLIWRGDKYLAAKDQKLLEALVVWNQKLQELETQLSAPHLPEVQRRLLYGQIGDARKGILRIWANMQLKGLFLEWVELCKKRDPIYEDYTKVKRALAGLAEPTKEALRELMGRESKLRKEMELRKRKDEIEMQIDEMYKAITANVCILELDVAPMTGGFRDEVIKLMSQLPKSDVVGFYAVRKGMQSHGQALARVLEHFQIRAASVGVQNRDLWNWFLGECYKRGIFLQKRVAGVLLATWEPFPDSKILLEIVSAKSLQGLSQTSPRVGSIRLSQAAFQTGEMAADTLQHALEDLLLRGPRALRVLGPQTSPEDAAL